jgi:GoLoco motif
MSDWSNSSLEKTRTYNVTTATTTTTTTSAAENGSKVRKKMPPKETEIVRKKEVEQIPSAPSSELFELLCRLQSARLDDQVKNVIKLFWP